MEIKKQNPVQDILSSTIGNLKNIIDADNVIGTPITTPEGNTIIPVSKVSVGFVSGGGEYSADNTKNGSEYPFSGGSGSGYCIHPIGFLSLSGGEVKMLSIDGKSGFDKLLKLIPDVISAIGDSKDDKKKK